LSNLRRTSSLLLVFVCATALAGFAQEKKQPKKKKEQPSATGVIVARLPAEYDPAAWKKFESEAGGFSILFPGTPEEETQKLQMGAHEISARILKFSALASYTVLYLDSPAGSNPDDEATRKLIDSSAKQAAQMFQATTLQHKEVTLDGYPGVSYVLRLPDGLGLRLRVYVVRGRLFQLMITTPPEQDATGDQRRFYEATANKFLDSFTLAPFVPPSPPRIAAGRAQGASAASERGRISVIGPVGPVGEGSVSGAPVSAPKNLPRAPISAGVLNGRATSRPAPAYPAAAVKERVEGVVVVAVVVDEDGKVSAAEAVGGPELLREAAVAAALKARFPITRLSGQPVKVAGQLTYNFVLR
jgi:TonB family protein